MANRKINNNKGIAIQEPFAPTIKLALGFNWFCCGVFYLFTGHGKF
jgi:hypothetical protein